VALLVGLRREALASFSLPLAPWGGESPRRTQVVVGGSQGHFEGGVRMKNRCLMCFAERSTDPYPGTDIQLCRGCKYQVDKLVGFWETQGYGFQLALVTMVINKLEESTEEGEGGTPLTPRGSTEEAPSEEPKGKSRKTSSDPR